jgi:hypothetical protein
MNRKKLGKLQDELDQMRASSCRAADVQSLAARLGRNLGNRGKHPMWVSDEFKELFALSIPDHGGRDLSRHVKKKILDNLQQDIFAWDAKLPREINRNGNGSEDEDG